MKEPAVRLLVAISLMAVFAFPVILIGPFEFFTELLGWVMEPEFGGPIVGYAFLVYIFALPLLGVFLFAHTTAKLIKQIYSLS
jgi:hypothetical protein